MELIEFSPLILHRFPKKLLNKIKMVPKDWELSDVDLLALLDLVELYPALIESFTPIIFLLLLTEVKNGSTCIHLQSPKIIASLKALGFAKVDTEIAKWLEQVKQQNFNQLIAADRSRFVPLILRTNSSGDFLYLYKTFCSENKINLSVEKLLASHGNQPFSNIKELIQQFNSTHAICLKNDVAIAYNQEQQDAIFAATTNPFTLITGGPGTGKTYTLIGILRAFLANGYQANDIILTAPTARAAARMQDTVSDNFAKIGNPLPTDLGLNQVESKTLHRLLGITLYDFNGQYSAELTLPYKVIIVDEASMVDVHLMRVLMKSLDLNQVHLVLMGDKDQLPSVSEGAILADLIQRLPKNKIITLKLSYRSNHMIAKYVTAIREQQTSVLEELPTYPNVDQFFQNQKGLVGKIDLNASYKKQLFDGIKSWVQNYYLKPILELNHNEVSEEAISDCLAKLSRVKILSLVKNGYLGVYNVNRICCEVILQALKQPLSQEHFLGMPIQILENNEQSNLYNGDMGICHYLQKSHPLVSFQKKEKLLSHSLYQIPPYQIGFCTTVHKSQGSEFENILFVIPVDCPDTLLNRQLIYTAISRAKEKCLILCKPKDLIKGAQTDFLRETGLLL